MTRVRNAAVAIACVAGILLAAGGWSTVLGVATANADPSRMLALGSKAPDFRLPDVVTGQTVSLATFADQQALVVMVLCRHCPYVQHVKQEVARLARDYAGRRVGFVAISANDVAAYPDDRPEQLKAMAEEAGFTFPFCYDETQDVATAYTAVAMPDFFLFDQDRRLVYRGQLDGSRPGNRTPTTGRDLREAIDAVLAGTPVNPDQKHATGCSIKWKVGHEPLYLRR